MVEPVQHIKTLKVIYTNLSILPWKKMKILLKRREPQSFISTLKGTKMSTLLIALYVFLDGC